MPLYCDVQLIASHNYSLVVRKINI